MTIDTNAIVSMTEANQNFSRVTRIAEQKGQAVIFKNNRPKYLLLDLDNAPPLGHHRRGKGRHRSRPRSEAVPARLPGVGQVM